MSKGEKSTIRLFSLFPHSFFFTFRSTFLLVVIAADWSSKFESERMNMKNYIYECIFFSVWKREPTWAKNAKKYRVESYFLSLSDDSWIVLSGRQIGYWSRLMNRDFRILRDAGIFKHIKWRRARRSKNRERYIQKWRINNEIEFQNVFFFKVLNIASLLLSREMIE